CAGDLPNSDIQVTGTVDPNVPGTYNLIYTITDPAGNPGTVVRDVHVVDTTPPSITLNGVDPMTVECHGSFSDPGATATDTCAGDLTSAIQVSGSVNADAPGAYTLTYTVSDGSNTTTKTRTVNVVDTTPPTIALSGANPMTVECHTTFADPGATATDSCAGSFAATASGTVNTNVPGTYTITYNASDAAGNAATPVTRTVNVVDTTPPVITLNGASSMTVECHTSFTDPGATASDSCAGDLTGAISVTGSVNPNVVGTYTLTYTVNDGQGHTITATRIVNVVDTLAPTITLNGASPMTVECHTGFTDPGATATDQCAGNLTSAIVVT